MTAVTRLLEAADRGDPNAAADLLPLVSAELRKLPSGRLAEEETEAAPQGYGADARLPL